MRGDPSAVPEGVRQADGWKSGSARHRIALFVAAYTNDDGDAPDTTLIGQSNYGAMLLLGDLRAVLAALSAAERGLTRGEAEDEHILRLQEELAEARSGERETLERAAKVAESYAHKDWESYDPHTIAADIRALAFAPGQPEQESK